MSISHGRLIAVTLGVTTILGLSFWFLLGYPFANHNESYFWIVELNRLDFVEAIARKMRPVANYRPLGQAVIWLTYKWSGGSIAPVQIFNYSVAGVAWLLLLAAIREKRAFAISALVVGAVFFSGYIYLFHLHGAFYSALLVLIAYTFMVYEQEWSTGRFLALTMLAYTCSLFHPYALLIYLASTGGLVLERWRTLSRSALAMVAGGGVVALLLVRILVFVPESEDLKTVAEMFTGVLSSYQSVEVNTAVSTIALLLGIATAMSIPCSRRERLVTVVFVLIAEGLLFQLSTPLVMGWVLIAIWKAVRLRKWWMASLLLMTSMFPAPAPTGSPTYTIYALMVCTVLLVYRWDGLEQRLHFLRPAVALPASALAILIVVLLRSGVEIPVVGRAASPLLSEQEKTFQLETVISWMQSSPYRDFRLVLLRDAENPSEATDAISRTHRPPTAQVFLDRYVGWLRQNRPQPAENEGALIVSFGDDRLDHEERIYQVDGRHAGPALVYLHEANSPRLP